MGYTTGLVRSSFSTAGLDGLTPDPHGQPVFDSIARIGECLHALDADRVLVTLDRAAVGNAGLGEELADAIASFEYAEFDGFTPNPRSEQGAAAARAAAAVGARVVLAVGGGSCLDVAKIAALGAPHLDRADELARGVRTQDVAPLPIVAVPTTAGTGSETTHFAAIYVDGKKVSVAHPGLRPAAAVLDERFHRTMPAGLAAASGLDALCQAIESLWAVGADAVSLVHAREAGPLVAEHLEPSVRTGASEHRRGMMIGAHLAGRAINISKTTASHALSYRLTQRYGLSHGHAVALSIGALARVNAETTHDDCLDPRGAGWVRDRAEEAAWWLGATPEGLGCVVAGLLERFGLPASLREAGVDRDGMAELAAGVDPVRLGNNPRRLTDAMVLGILEDSWAKG